MLVVVLPVLHDVVGGDVGVVPGAHEAGQPEVLAHRVVQQGHAHGRRLAEQAHPTGPRHRSRGGVQLHRVLGVDQPERVGTQRADAVGAGQVDHRAVVLRRDVGAGQHDDAVRALVRGVDHHPAQLRGRDGEHGQVEPARHGGDRAGGGHPGHRGLVGADGHHLAAEAAAQHRVDQALDPVARAVHDDPLRVQQPVHRRALRPVLAALHHPDRGVGGQDRELDQQHPVLDALGHPVAGVGEHLGHPAVLRQHLGDEAGDAALACGLGQVLQQQVGDAAPLVGVLDEEGDLGPVVLGPVEAADADHLLAHGEDERHPVDVVHLGEAPHVAGAEAGVGGEEAQVLRLGRDAVVEGDEQVGVGGPDGAQPGHPAVGQHHVGLPLPRVARGKIDLAHGHGPSLRNRGPAARLPGGRERWARAAPAGPGWP